MYGIKKRDVYIAAGFISLILSFLAALKTYLINSDGICYVKSAEAMNQDCYLLCIYAISQNGLFILF